MAPELRGGAREQIRSDGRNDAQSQSADEGIDELLAGKIAMVINTPEGRGPLLDSRTIRSTSVQLSLPLFTTIAAADAAVRGIERSKSDVELNVCSIQEYLRLL